MGIVSNPAKIKTLKYRLKTEINVFGDRRYSAKQIGYWFLPGFRVNMAAGENRPFDDFATTREIALEKILMHAKYERQNDYTVEIVEDFDV